MSSNGDRVTAITNRLLTHAATTILLRRGTLDHETVHSEDQFQRQRQPQATRSVVDEGTSFPGLIPWLQQMISYSVIGMAMIALSTVAYGIFYFLVMPSPCTQQPLYFDYSGTATFPPYYQKHLTSSDVVSTVHVHSNKQTVFPWAAVDLFSLSSSWEAHRSEVLPSPRVGLSQNRIFKAGQLYFLELHLLLPESARNRGAGIFGVAVDLYDNTQTNLATSIRSTRLPHESMWLSVIRKCVCLIPILIGAVDESRRVVIPAFRNFRESAEYPLQHVFVKLKMPSIVAPPVEVIAGEIRIGEELNVLQRLLKDWFYTCYTAGSSVLVATQTLALLLWRLYRQRQQRMKEEEEQIEQDFDLGSNLSFSSWEELNAAGCRPVGVGASPEETLPQHHAEPETETGDGTADFHREENVSLVPNEGIEQPHRAEFGEDGEVSDDSFTSARSEISSMDGDGSDGENTARDRIEASDKVRQECVLSECSTSGPTSTINAAEWAIPTSLEANSASSSQLLGSPMQDRCRGFSNSSVSYPSNHLGSKLQVDGVKRKRQRLVSTDENSGDGDLSPPNEPASFCFQQLIDNDGQSKPLDLPHEQVGLEEDRAGSFISFYDKSAKFSTTELPDNNGEAQTIVGDRGVQNSNDEGNSRASNHLAVTTASTVDVLPSQKLALELITKMIDPFVHSR